MWYHIRGSCARDSTIIFGKSSIVMYKWLKFGRKALLHIVLKHRDTMVSLSKECEIEQFISAINIKCPILMNVWAAADGLKLLTRSPSSDNKQNMLLMGGNTFTMQTASSTSCPMMGKSEFFFLMHQVPSTTAR